MTKNEWKIHINTKFMIIKDHIELREQDDTFIASICCMGCVKQLQRAINKFIQLNDKKRRSQ